MIRPITTAFSRLGQRVSRVKILGCQRIRADRCSCNPVRKSRSPPRREPSPHLRVNAQSCRLGTAHHFPCMASRRAVAGPGPPEHLECRTRVTAAVGAKGQGGGGADGCSRPAPPGGAAPRPIGLPGARPECMTTVRRPPPPDSDLHRLRLARAQPARAAGDPPRPSGGRAGAPASRGREGVPRAWPTAPAPLLTQVAARPSLSTHLCTSPARRSASA